MKKIVITTVCILGTGLLSFAQTRERVRVSEPINKSNIKTVQPVQNTENTAEPEKVQPEVQKVKVEEKPRNVRPAPKAVESVRPKEPVEKKELKKD